MDSEIIILKIYFNKLKNIVDSKNKYQAYKAFYDIKNLYFRNIISDKVSYNFMYKISLFFNTVNKIILRRKQINLNILLNNNVSESNSKKDGLEMYLITKEINKIKLSNKKKNKQLQKNKEIISKFDKEISSLISLYK